MTLDDFLGGKVQEHNGGQFYKIEKNIDELDTGIIGDYIRQNKKYLTLEHIKEKFPELSGIPKSKMLFWDLEVCGLGYKPIITIASTIIAYNQVKSQCLLARDPHEEGPMIKYFLDFFSNYQASFTYCGKPFDIPRLGERAKQHSS